MNIHQSSKTTVDALLSAASWEAKLQLTSQDRKRMEESTLTLSRKLAEGSRVYGITQGFGPLVDFAASSSLVNQGTGLLSHLAVGQGEPLSPEVSRFMIMLRLKGMMQGYSAVSTDFWLRLADLWNQGFTPVVPSEGSVSASGDLVPLAHAALAFAGEGEAWSGSPESGWIQIPAREVLSRLGSPACVWSAREALAFVNGTTASLAVTCHNYRDIMMIARSLASLSGRIACLFGVNPDPYTFEVSHVRGHQGQLLAAAWMRSELELGSHHVNADRPLQEPYSLRCAPQVLGAVIDHLRGQEQILVQEANGCTDNPVVYQGRVFHGGNFHALPVALCSDQQSLCVQQLAFVAERQLALLLNPGRNGGKPPMLTSCPGSYSGLAGVQIAATSFVAKIRQLAYPATLTALPTNLDNQDHVPMALNGACAVAKVIELAWLVIGSLALAVNQWTFLDNTKISEGTIWWELRNRFESLDTDRPLSAEVQQAAKLMKSARFPDDSSSTTVAEIANRYA
jgi:histidine ammonia-lyase